MATPMNVNLELGGLGLRALGLGGGGGAGEDLGLYKGLGLKDFDCDACLNPPEPVLQLTLVHLQPEVQFTLGLWHMSTMNSAVFPGRLPTRI